ncbi:MAG: creatininase family protein [Chloroflexi bacterium]|nr:creatininase family protein [Chloroflexota bacterium]
MTNSVQYVELGPTEFRQRLAEAPIAYLPLGTLEWHGEHLPLGSDGLQSSGFFTELAKRVGGIVLPMLFLGPDRHEKANGRDYYGMDLYGFPKGQPQQLDGSAYWVNNELFGQILEAILARLARAGFKIVVAHGHCPSGHFFQDHIEAWSKQFGLELYTCWRPRPEEADGLGIMTDHAAANETSLMMALHPDLVHLDRLSPDPSVWPMAVSGQDPRTEASSQRGQQAIARQVERMSSILREALSRHSA